MALFEGSCPFCCVEPARIRYETECIRVIADGYPVTPGHRLVLPRDHVGSWFDLAEQELASVLEGIRWAKTDIEREHAPDGYNIGINDGAAAGQTVHHVHVHVIPRYQGDCDDPRGGVRWVVPHRADYWSNS